MIQQGNIRFFIPPDLIEPEALQQVRNTASMQTMRHAGELVRPLYRLRQIINVKGD